jgi:CheY-like chemotaxis protein
MGATKNDAAEKKRRTGSSASALVASRKPADILMVEDSPTDAELAGRALRRGKIGNPLKVVVSGEAALDYLLGTGACVKAGATRPLLILLDLQLPGMSGLDLLQKIKIDERLWDIPVISLSLTRSAPAIVMCLQRGVADHMIKPVDCAALLSATKRLKLVLAKLPDDAVAGEAHS